MKADISNKKKSLILQKILKKTNKNYYKLVKDEEDKNAKSILNSLNAL